MSDSPADLQYQEEHIHDNRAPVIYGSSISLFIIAIIFVGLRFLSRRMTNKHLKNRRAQHGRSVSNFGSDDYTILAALVFSIPPAAASWDAAHHALGRHVIAAGKAGVVLFLKDLLWYQVFWTIAMVLAKLSYLLFYERLFKSSRAFQIALRITGAIVIAWGITNIFGAIFECTPVSYLWDKTLPGGHCFNYVDFAYFTASFNIAMDITILTLPLKPVWSMTLSRAQKISVSGIFLLGGFIVLISAVRIRYLHLLTAASPDVTWVETDIDIWTNTEMWMSIICANLPTLKPLVISVIRSSNYLNSRYGSVDEPESPDELNPGGHNGARNGSTPYLSNWPSNGDATKQMFASNPDVTDKEMVMYGVRHSERPSRPMSMTIPPKASVWPSTLQTPSPHDDEGRAELATIPSGSDSAGMV